MTFERVQRLSSVLFVLALWVTAGASCSSGDAKSGAAVAADAAAGETANIALRPCNLHTTYQGKPLTGDSQCIAPPPAAEGFQFHYGPTNYDDPVEMAKYILLPGQETTDCVFFKTATNASRPLFSTSTTAVCGDPGRTTCSSTSRTRLLVTDTGTSGPTPCNQTR